MKEKEAFLLSHRSSQHKGCLTMRAPDWWESARFQAVSWLEVGSGKMAFSRPAHQRVTPAVGTLLAE
jgi:hypothetical protein